MSHIETLVMNEVRKALENLQKQGVGYIDYETMGNIYYSVDNRIIRVKIETIPEQEAETLADYAE